jgi:predicted CDP-diglyceride synthetase/phosphatidate cytidylyltransferase
MSMTWKENAPKIRTIWFMVAMIPLVIMSGALCILVLIIVSPLTAYAFVTKKHLKPPGSRPRTDN